MATPTRSTSRKSRTLASTTSGDTPTTSTPAAEKPSTPSSASRSPGRMRSHSPLSISRMEEKEELAHLNDRFAGYIDYVRSLEKDRTILQRKIDTVTETQHSEVTGIRSMFEDEMASLRKALDDLAREKASLEVDNKKLKNEWEDMKNKLNRRDNDIRNLEKKLETRERECAELRAEHNRYTTLVGDYDQLKKQFDTAKKQLEQETLLRTDLENKIQTLKEELAFQENVHREETQKLKERTVVVEEHIETKAKASYDSKLREELQAMREQSREELEDYKEMMEEAFQKKFEEMKIVSDRSTTDAVRFREELSSMRKRLETISAELAAKTAEVDTLNARLRNLNDMLAKERQDYESQIQIYKEENAQLRREIEERFREFNDLMAVKIALDQEILAYRKMLEGEEERCSISPSKRESPFTGSGRKRRRMDESEGVSFLSGSQKEEISYRMSTSAKGPIRIDEVDAADGHFVRLINESEKDVQIGNWILRYEADSKDPVSYKFHRGVTMKPSATCTVWSSDAGVTHNSPVDLVLKAQRFPGSATHVTVTVSDTDGNEQASTSCDKEVLYSRVRQAAGRRGGLAAKEEKCSVM